MIFSETPLSGAYVVDIDCVKDNRGFFARTHCADEFAAQGLVGAMSQCSVSFNERRGTLRGLHYQAEPHTEHKLVRCTAGAIFDVIVDMRAESPSFRRWFATELTSENHRALYIPQGMAHGFISLTDSTEVYYMISVPYSAEFARGVRWNDPTLCIQWPLQPIVMSTRDAEYPLLESLVS